MQQIGFCRQLSHGVDGATGDIARRELFYALRYGERGGPLMENLIYFAAPRDALRVGDKPFALREVRLLYERAQPAPLFVGGSTDQHPAIRRAIGIPRRGKRVTVAGSRDRLADGVKRQKRGERAHRAIIERDVDGLAHAARAAYAVRDQRPNNPDLGVVGKLFGSVGKAFPLPDRKSTRLNSSHIPLSRMPSSA